MEVVLSPGRFGDETPGVPFKNEEIREWSHVDRLTGMLERARVETGRWQTSNEGAARSYGKVIDSRERNSADGSLVQRARRQVEIFQSQGSGRSVQVVRASQWSSSRVTDSTSTNPLALTGMNKKEEDKFTNLSRLESPPKSHCRKEAISERLSTLLGSFAYPVSSTVPLRRIDSKYSSRTALLKNSKRSNSNEDLTSLSSHDKNYPQIKSQTTEMNKEKKLSHQMENSNEPRIKIRQISTKREDEKNIRDRLEISVDSGKKIPGVISHEAEPTRSAKSAIHLLPSSKANTTVINLINNDSRIEVENDTLGAKRPLVSWVMPTSSLVQESPHTSDLENLISRRDAKIEESTNSSISGRSIKRVGFCKTEIHFAADSGKVNIVETDEKPPPTNKFRRRRRLTGIANNKNSPIINSSAYEPKIVGQTSDSMGNNRCSNHDEIKTKIDPNLQRGHTTTVNFGSDELKNSKRANEEGKIDELSATKEDTSSHEASSKIERDLTRQDYDVLCTDAENNQVLLKVVTTHEPTIARVENDAIRKRLKKTTNLEKSSKNEISKSNKPQREHTYVNVFTGSDTRVPIYENYKISDSSIKNNKICNSIKMKEKSCPPETISRISDAKSQSTNDSVRREVENADLEKNKIEVVEKTKASTELISNNDAVNLSNGSKKTRVKTKDNRLLLAGKKSSGELSSSNSTNSAGASRLRNSKFSKNSTIMTTATKRAPIRNQDSIASCERDLKQSIEISKANSQKSNSSKSSPREISSTRTKKSEITTNKVKPMEVVYQTAVYNMKNEKLSKPLKGKELKGPRYLNELICGAKTKRPSDSKNGKTANTAQNAVNNKGASQAVRHWK